MKATIAIAALAVAAEAAVVNPRDYPTYGGGHGGGHGDKCKHKDLVNPVRLAFQYI
jgi:hypothetical protein